MASICLGLNVLKIEVKSANDKPQESENKLKQCQ